MQVIDFVGGASVGAWLRASESLSRLAFGRRVRLCGAEIEQFGLVSTLAAIGHGLWLADINVYSKLSTQQCPEAGLKVCGEVPK